MYLRFLKKISLYSSVRCFIQSRGFEILKVKNQQISLSKMHSYKKGISEAQEEDLVAQDSQLEQTVTFSTNKN